MSITQSQLDHLSQLSMLAIRDDEQQDLLEDLNNILGMVDALQAIDTDDVVPLSSPSAASQRLRIDEVTEIPSPDDYQSCASLTEDQLYLVPKVIE